MSVLTTGKYTILDPGNITNPMLENTKFSRKTMIESYFLKTYLDFVEDWSWNCWQNVSDLD